MQWDIQINKASRVSLRQQISAQVEFQIATGKMKPGDRLPAVRALARKLGVHHNTVSQAYKDVTAIHLLAAKQGSSSRVWSLDGGPLNVRPELDELINRTIREARLHGYSLRELSTRVQERLLEEPPNHVLVLSYEVGMRRLLKTELEQALKCRVEACSPPELASNPELAIGALVVSPPGVLPSLAAILRKDRPPIPLVYSSAKTHLEITRNLLRSSIVVVASVSEHFLSVARGVLSPVMAPHTLVGCLIGADQIDRIPAGDLIFCDSIVFTRLTKRRVRKKIVPYNLIAPESLKELASAMKASR